MLQIVIDRDVSKRMLNCSLLEACLLQDSFEILGSGLNAESRPSIRDARKTAL